MKLNAHKSLAGCEMYASADILEAWELLFKVRYANWLIICGGNHVGPVQWGRRFMSKKGLVGISLGQYLVPYTASFMTDGDVLFSK